MVDISIVKGLYRLYTLHVYYIYIRYIFDIYFTPRRPLFSRAILGGFLPTLSRWRTGTRPGEEEWARVIKVNQSNDVITIHIYIYIYICRGYTYIYTHIYIHIYTYNSEFIQTCIHMYIYIYIYVFLIYIYVYIYVCACTCLYISVRHLVSWCEPKILLKAWWMGEVICDVLTLKSMDWLKGKSTGTIDFPMEYGGFL